MCPPTFDLYRSELDGTPVVHVDTHGMPENSKGPMIRIYLNDEPLFENPRYPGRDEPMSSEFQFFSPDDGEEYDLICGADSSKVVLGHEIHAEGISLFAEPHKDCVAYIDTFHMRDDHVHSEEPFVQIVIYDPQDPDGDPAYLVRIYADRVAVVEGG